MAELPLDARAVPGFPDYFVTKAGVVWSRRGKSPRVMVGQRRPRGYRRVLLASAEGYKPFYVHRLVLLAHVGKPPTSAHQARHLNGVAGDDRLDNLAWGTATENANDKRDHGTLLEGEQAPASKLTESAVCEMRRLARERGLTCAQIAALHGVSSSTAQRAITGEGWNCVVEEPPVTPGWRQRHQMRIRQETRREVAPRNRCITRRQAKQELRTLERRKRLATDEAERLEWLRVVLLWMERNGREVFTADASAELEEAQPAQLRAGGVTCVPS